jgi:hypothetical protein
MVITWQRLILFAAFAAALIVGYYHYFGAAARDATVNLPKAYAEGNYAAYMELEKRPYDRNLSGEFRRMVTGSPDPKVREAALTFIAKGSESAEEAVIISALNDSEPKVREAACVAARKRKLKEAVEVLINLLDDPDVNVQGSAQMALQEITGIEHYMGRSEWSQRWELMKEQDTKRFTPASRGKGL